MLYLISGFTVWFFGSIGAGLTARTKGHSGILWFLVSLVISPVIAILIVHEVLEYRTKPEKKNGPRHYQ